MKKKESPPQTDTSKENLKKTSEPSESHLPKTNEVPPEPQRSHYDEATEKLQELSQKTVLDSTFMLLSNGPVAFTTEARLKLSTEPDKKPVESFKELSKEWSKKPLSKSVTGLGGEVLQRRFYMGLSNSVADTLMSNVLPRPKGIKTEEDAATVAIRTTVKASFEAATTFNSEACAWYKRYGKGQDELRFKMNFAKGYALRTPLPWLAVEVTNSQQYDSELDRVGASFKNGMAAGALAGLVDYKITFAKMKPDTKDIVKSNPRAAATAAAAALAWRSVHAGFTCGAFVASGQVGSALDRMYKKGGEDDKAKTPPRQDYIKEIIKEHQERQQGQQPSNYKKPPPEQRGK